MKKSIWSQVNNLYEEDGFIFIDAWETPDENESGKVIAKVNKETGDVTYLDERAKQDVLAQESIKETQDLLSKFKK